MNIVQMPNTLWSTWSLEHVEHGYIQTWATWPWLRWLCRWQNPHTLWNAWRLAITLVIFWAISSCSGTRGTWLHWNMSHMTMVMLVMFLANAPSSTESMTLVMFWANRSCSGTRGTWLHWNMSHMNMVTLAMFLANAPSSIESMTLVMFWANTSCNAVTHNKAILEHEHGILVTRGQKCRRMHVWCKAQWVCVAQRISPY